MTNPCPFCNYHGPSEILHEYMGGNVFVIEPINPVTPGHVLVIPREHVEDFAEGGADLDHVVAATMIAARWWTDEKGGDWNLVTSKGTLATQTVRHLHVHLIPRRKDDGLKLPWSQPGSDT